MATVTLTARYLDQLKSHGKRYEVFDAIVPGLAIRVSASGRKTFTLYYRHHRRMRRVGLGRYPDVLLEKARKIATQHRGRIFDGAIQQGEKQTEHTQDESTVAVRRLELGNFSNVKGVGAGVFEYRIDFGPGYRVYFGKDGDALVILLGGGTKRRQDRDIATAQMRWKDYKKRKSQET